MGVASTEVVLGVGVAVSTNTAGPQDAKNNRISPMGNNRKMLGNFFMLFSSQFLICDNYNSWRIPRPSTNGSIIPKW